MVLFLLPWNTRAEFVQLEEAKEIVNTSTLELNPRLPLATYKSAEDPNNPGKEITDEAWEEYEPPEGYIKNTTRNLQFNESEFLGSPSSPGQFTYIETSDGYTWGEMSFAINAMWSPNFDYPGDSAYYAAIAITTPPKRHVKVTANYKAQNMKFYANEDGLPSSDPNSVRLERYFVTDQWGNRYIMHAAGVEQSEVRNAFETAVLPDGWIKEIVQLEEDLILSPATSSDGSYHYSVFRDSADNTYHQISWGEQGINLATQVIDMPIWGGKTDDLLLIRPEYDSLIYGGGGKDTVKLDGLFTAWSITHFSSDGSLVELFREGRNVTLHDISFLQFDDITIATFVIPEPGTILLMGLGAGYLLLRKIKRDS